MSVQKRGEETNPKPNWEELAATEPLDREWQKGTTFLVIGIILLVFDASLGVVFVPADLRAGTTFWIDVSVIWTVAGIGLVIAGFVMKWKASLERAHRTSS